MKSKLLLISMMLFCGILYAFSQSSFYYYKGKKQPIQEDLQKVSIIAPKEKEAKSLSATSPKMKKSKTIHDSKYDISVVEFQEDLKANKQKYNSAIESLKKESGETIILPCYKAIDGKELVLTNYINIKLKTEKDINILRSVINKYQLEIVELNKFMPLWYTLRITEKTKGTTLEIANKIYESNLFAAATPDFSFDALSCSNDPRFSGQWGLYNNSYPNVDISICDAWKYATGHGVTIAIVDQGIDMIHRDLEINIHPLSYDTESGKSPSQILGDHGTHCAGIAAATRNNGLQVAGVAPDAKLMSISIFATEYDISTSGAADGINWAWKNGAHIISCSWQSPENEMISDAIDLALLNGRNGRGCILVCSSNNGDGTVSYPANYRPEILSVGAVDQAGNVPTWSNTGLALDVVAPGVHILSTVNNNMVQEKTGTSMACPHVAGVAALILERNSSLTVKQVNDIIEKNTKKIGNISYGTVKENGTWNYDYGYGLVNAYAAVLNPSIEGLETLWALSQSQYKIPNISNATWSCSGLSGVTIDRYTGMVTVANNNALKGEVTITASYSGGTISRKINIIPNQVYLEIRTASGTGFNSYPNQYIGKYASHSNITVNGTGDRILYLTLSIPSVINGITTIYRWNCSNSSNIYPNNPGQQGTTIQYKKTSSTSQVYFEPLISTGLGAVRARFNISFSQFYSAKVINNDIISISKSTTEPDNSIFHPLSDTSEDNITVNSTEIIKSDNSILHPSSGTSTNIITQQSNKQIGYEIFSIYGLSRSYLKGQFTSEDNSEHQVDISSLPKGFYVLNLYQDGQMVHSEKFMVNR